MKLLYKLTLNKRSKVKRLIHIRVLHQLKHDIRINRVRVEALVSRLVVRLQLDDGILPHRYIKVLLHLVRSQNKRLNPLRRFRFRRVSMNADKQIRFMLIHYVCAFLQGQKDIRRACINEIDLREVFLDELPCQQRHIKVQILLIRNPPYCTCIFPAVSGIYHHGERLIRLLCTSNDRRKQKAQARKRIYIEKRIELHIGHYTKHAAKVHKKIDIHKILTIFLEYKSLFVQI